MSNSSQFDQPWEDGQLLTYLEQVTASGVQAQFRQHPDLASALQTLAETDAILTAALDRAGCPPTETLWAYHHHRLPLAQHQAIEGHLQVCRFCPRELTLLQDPTQQHAVMPVADVASRVQAGLRQILQAVPLLTSAPAPALRGATQTARVYEAADYRLVLALTPPISNAGVWQVEGQVMPPEAMADEIPSGSVSLLQGSTSQTQDQIDEFGYFVLNDVPAATYTIRLDLDQTYIFVEGFSVP